MSLPILISFGGNDMWIEASLSLVVVGFTCTLVLPLHTFSLSAQVLGRETNCFKKKAPGQ